MEQAAPVKLKSECAIQTCPRCRSLSIIKNGISAQGKQRYRCRDSFRQFITDYTYQGCRPELRQMIVPMTMNGSGIGDICRVLRVSINTVLKTIHQKAALVPEPVAPERITEIPETHQLGHRYLVHVLCYN